MSQSGQMLGNIHGVVDMNTPWTKDNMSRKLKATYTCDPTHDLLFLDRIFDLTRRPIFHKLRERIHQWAYTHGCHDQVIGSWWYRGWGKFTVRIPKNEQLHEKWAKQLSDKINEDIFNMISKEMNSK